MGTQYTDETLSEALTNIVAKYYESGIKSSIKRNKHMNYYEDSKFDERKAKKMLLDFVGMTIPRLKHESPTVVELLSGLAKAIPIYLDAVPYKLPVVVKEAVLVDFVNFMGCHYCVDFGMYTDDIEKERGGRDPYPPRKALTEQEVFKSLGEGKVVRKMIWSTHKKDWVMENSYFFKDGKLHMIQKYEDSEDFHNFPINHEFKQNDFVKYEDM